VERGLRTIGAVLVLVLLAACSGDDDSPAATLQTSTTAHTTTTQSVESEVEAAYLKSWDVYSNAVRTFDSSELASVYTGDALKLRLDEVARLKAANTPATTKVTHHISAIDFTNDSEAVVHDDYENHSVLLDGKTGHPIEQDPKSVVKRQYGMRIENGTWKVWLVVSS